MMQPNSEKDVELAATALINTIHQGVLQASDLRQVVATAYAQCAVTACELGALEKTLKELGSFQPAIFRANFVQALRDRIERMTTPQLLMPHAVAVNGKAPK